MIFPFVFMIILATRLFQFPLSHLSFQKRPDSFMHDCQFEFACSDLLGQKCGCKQVGDRLPAQRDAPFDKGQAVSGEIVLVDLRKLPCRYAFLMQYEIVVLVPDPMALLGYHRRIGGVLVVQEVLLRHHPDMLKHFQRDKHAAAMGEGYFLFGHVAFSLFPDTVDIDPTLEKRDVPAAVRNDFGIVVIANLGGNHGTRIEPGKFHQFWP